VKPPNLAELLRRYRKRTRRVDPLTRAYEKNALYNAQTTGVMTRVLTRRSNCVDVGAHTGTVLSEILAIAPDGFHFAFEPLPDAFDQLAASFGSRPNVSLHNVALSDAAGVSDFFHVVTNPGYSGLRRWKQYDRPNERIEKITVGTARMDDVVPRDIPIHFIKVDVEGGELGVFLGARATIERSRPWLVFEHGLGAADSFGTTPDDVYRLLVGEYGYAIALMDRWLVGDRPLGRAEFADHFYKKFDWYFMAYHVASGHS
jgi:FkbM family methyltransferase